MSHPATAFSTTVGASTDFTSEFSRDASGLNLWESNCSEGKEERAPKKQYLNLDRVNYIHTVQVGIYTSIFVHLQIQVGGGL